jgi:hypothetical protein
LKLIRRDNSSATSCSFEFVIVGQSDLSSASQSIFDAIGFIFVGEIAFIFRVDRRWVGDSIILILCILMDYRVHWWCFTSVVVCFGSLSLDARERITRATLSLKVRRGSLRGVTLASPKADSPLLPFATDLGSETTFWA